MTEWWHNKRIKHVTKKPEFAARSRCTVCASKILLWWHLLPTPPDKSFDFLCPRPASPASVQTRGDETLEHVVRYLVSTMYFAIAIDDKDLKHQRIHHGTVRKTDVLKAGPRLISSVGQSAGLSIPRSSVRFRWNPKELRTQIYMDLSYIDPQARVLNYCINCFQ